MDPKTESVRRSGGLLPEVSNVFYDEARDAFYYPARRLPRIYEVKFK